MASARVLVVDDNHLLRRLLSMILEDAGFAPLDAESGEVALRLAVEDPPDAMIVDDAMPGMRGGDLVRALRRSTDLRLRLMPVVGLSGRPEGLTDLTAAGANVVIAKPVEEDALLEALVRARSAGRAGEAAGSPA
jgi:CheY-like chemotaxis protein